MTTPNLDYLHPQLRPLAVPVADLTPDPNNARRRDKRAIEALKKSIKQGGFRSTIIVQQNAEGELIIRAGNGRCQAMRELGYEYIPALIYQEGDEEAIAHAIADNRTAELAEWDFKALNENLALLEDSFSLDDLGWTEDERGELNIFTLDGQEDFPETATSSEEIDPDDVEDYEPTKDFYLVKIEKVPPDDKAEVVAVINKALADAGYGLEAKAY